MSREKLTQLQEKILPKGTDAFGPNFDEIILDFNAGGHCNTNIYIAPSKSA
jgi:hypothetical protein